MNELWTFALALAAGILIGMFFFGGLWWTVQKGISSKHPALWFFGSLILRMSLALSGFYWIGHGHWDRLLLCLAGFLIARFAVKRFTESPKEGDAHAS